MLSPVKRSALDCSVLGAAETIGDAWCWLVLADAIIHGTRRFDEFQSRLHIARSTLSSRLISLCTNGLMIQEGRDYNLTNAGQDLFPGILTAMAWGDRWYHPEGEEPLTTTHTGCGHHMHGDLRCAACGEALSARDVAFNRRPAGPPATPDSARRSRIPAPELLQRAGPSSIARTQQVIGDRWNALVIRECFYGVKHFDDFQKHLGIATNILTDRLQRLVDNEILCKQIYCERPARYEYRLTDKGLDLYPVPLAMFMWGDRWVAANANRVRLTHLPCGKRLKPVLACSACQEPVSRSTVTFTHRR